MPYDIPTPEEVAQAHAEAQAQLILAVVELIKTGMVNLDSCAPVPQAWHGMTPTTQDIVKTAFLDAGWVLSVGPDAEGLENFTWTPCEVTP